MTIRTAGAGLALPAQRVIHSDFMGGTFDGRPVPRHDQEMTEPSEPPTQPTPANAAPPPYAAKGSRLYQAAAWVVIVAGIVFVVAVIFFAGAAVAWHNQPYHHHHHHGLFHPGGPDGPGPGAGQWLFVFPGGPPPGMGPAGPGGPPMMPGGPGMGPGGPGMGPG
jgi:hypothetical protein